MPMIEFPCPDGSVCTGYLAESGAGRPGVIVIQEWWGLNPHIQDITERFATAGYNALAPDLYHGRVAQNVDEARHMMDSLDFTGASTQDIQGAVDFLKARSGNAKVGIVGFCMGGALVITSAVHLSSLSAGVCFYGIPPKDVADPARIRIPLQGHFASRDNWCTPALVDDLERSMTSAGNRAEVYRYEASHAFFNKTRPAVHDPEASKLAWERTLTFLGAHLAG